MMGKVEEHLNKKPINRKEFMTTLGKFSAGTCLCAAAAGMHAAFGSQESPSKSAQAPPPPQDIDRTKPGEKSIARAAKRMEFGDIWVRRFFETMDRTVDEPTRRKLMTANGRACFAAYAGPPTKKAGPDAFEKFAAWIAEKGKNRGYSIDGRVISFTFVGSAETGQEAPEGVCLCSMGEAQKPGEISPTFCLCSVGYVQEMYERLLGRPVEVELAESVLKGGRRCSFRITVGLP